MNQQQANDFSPEKAAKLGNCLKWYFMIGMESGDNWKEIGIRHDYENAFPGHSELQLEYFGLIETLEDKYFLTEKGVNAIEDMLAKNQPQEDLPSGPAFNDLMAIANEWFIPPEFLVCNEQ